MDEEKDLTPAPIPQSATPPAPAPTVYQLQVHCTNCGNYATVNVPFGAKIADACCPFCQCTTLQR